jgi:hypothetical protein
VEPIIALDPYISEPAGQLLRLAEANRRNVIDWHFDVIEAFLRYLSAHCSIYMPWPMPPLPVDNPLKLAPSLYRRISTSAPITAALEYLQEAQLGLGERQRDRQALYDPKRGADVSLEQWITLTPPELLSAHSKLGSQFMGALQRQGTRRASLEARSARPSDKCAADRICPTAGAR